MMIKHTLAYNENILGLISKSYISSREDIKGRIASEKTTSLNSKKWIIVNGVVRLVSVVTLRILKAF